MADATFDHASTHRRAIQIAALAALAGGLALASPACADPLAAGGAAVAGTAAMTPPRESTTIVPGSVDREQSPDIVSQPAAPAGPPLREARPEAHAPTPAQLTLGVPLRCDDPAGFFPHVAACKLAWRAITPIVPAVIEPEAQPRARTATVTAPAPQPVSAPPQAPVPAKPAPQKLATAEPDVHLTPPKRASAAPEKAPPPPQPERSMTVALPAAASPPAPPPTPAPPRQDLAAVVGDLPQKPDRPAGNGSDVAWSAPRAGDAGAVLTAQSRQASSEGGAVAMVEAACNMRDKQFSLRAALVDTTGAAIMPLTERRQIGDAEMQPTYFHTELAFNKLVLTRGYGGATLSDESANTLLAAKQALYEIKTREGTVVIKIAATDGNLRTVLQACQSHD